MIVFLCLSVGVQASEFRSLRPILTPTSLSLAGEVVPRQQVKPVSRRVAQKVIEKLVSAWNNKDLDRVLGKKFFDRSRLNDAMNSKVPRDAHLAVLAIQDVQTLQQQMVDSPKGKRLVSMLSITVKTQLSFNDPVNGYQRREGTNEYIMRIEQRAY